MPTEQYVKKDWDDLPEKDIVSVSAIQVRDMMSDPESRWWQLKGMENIVLFTTGRKSGDEHAVALPIWRDKNGDRIVVASFQGSEAHPAWFLNLRDRGRGAVLFLSQVGLHPTDPEVLSGSDYADTWAGLVEDRAWYEEYQLATNREIPLVRLPEMGTIT